MSLMFQSAVNNTANNREGSGKYRPLPRKRKQAAKKSAEKELTYLDKVDSRMRFNNSKDPIYFAFEYIENRSLIDLTKDFVKDSFFEIANFVSKVAR